MARVLDVGQCPPDHRMIAQLMESLGAEVAQAALIDEAMERLRSERFDLVCVNRKLDADYSDGTELVRRMQADEALRSIPVMLISNYPEAQAEAIKLGAVLGFGKLEIGLATVRERVLQQLSAGKKV